MKKTILASLIVVLMAGSATASWWWFDGRYGEYDACEEVNPLAEAASLEVEKLSGKSDFVERQLQIQYVATIVEQNPECFTAEERAQAATAEQAATVHLDRIEERRRG